MQASQLCGTFTNASNLLALTGNIDRVTGDVEADTEGLTSIHYSLKCRPTQRMF
jgi:hypothetical protein